MVFLKSGKQSEAFFVELGSDNIISSWLVKVSGDIHVDIIPCECTAIFYITWTHDIQKVALRPAHWIQLTLPQSIFTFVWYLRSKRWTRLFFFFKTDIFIVTENMPSKIYIWRVFSCSFAFFSRFTFSPGIWHIQVCVQILGEFYDYVKWWLLNVKRLKKGKWTPRKTRFDVTTGRGISFFLPVRLRSLGKLCCRSCTADVPTRRTSLEVSSSDVLRVGRLLRSKKFENVKMKIWGCEV